MTKNEAPFEYQMQTWNIETDNSHVDKNLESEELLSRKYEKQYGGIEEYSTHIDFSSSMERITLLWKNLNVYAPVMQAGSICCRKGPQEYKQILNDVNGYVEPGTLLAVMGPSGAGKSTFLNILTHRNRGTLHVDGEVYANGRVVGRAMNRISAYVQQDDLFVGSLTVKEQLVFQALLRMDNHISTRVRMQRVEEVMYELGLTKCADTVIGYPGTVKAISGGERKRLAFGCEVLTNPPVMFCDEPTSGLDSFMAESVVQTLKKMASKGKTIMCTIHQPSSEVYALFDKLLLMVDGKVAYLGPRSSVLPFLESTGFPCPAAFNPADHIIRCLAHIPGREEECSERISRVCDVFSESKFGYEIQNQLSRLEDKSFDEFDNGKETQLCTNPYKANWWEQFKAVLWRSWIAMIRDRKMLISKCGRNVITAIFLGLIYLGQDLTQEGVMNINGAIFAAIINIALTPMLAAYSFLKNWHMHGNRNLVSLLLTFLLLVSLLPRFLPFGIATDSIFELELGIATERDWEFHLDPSSNCMEVIFWTFAEELPIFMREHHNGMYRVDVYYICKNLAEFPVTVFTPIFFIVIYYWMVGLYPSWDGFIIAMIVLIVHALDSVSFGYIISCVAGSLSMALVVGPLLMVPFLIVGGFFVNIESIPPYFRWMKKLSWFAYAFELLAVNQWERVFEIHCEPEEYDSANYTTGFNITTENHEFTRCFKDGESVLESLSFHKSDFVKNAGALVVLFVVYRVIAFLALLWRSYKHK